MFQINEQTVSKGMRGAILKTWGPREPFKEVHEIKTIFLTILNTIFIEFFRERERKKTSMWETFIGCSLHAPGIKPKIWVCAPTSSSVQDNNATNQDTPA